MKNIIIPVLLARVMISCGDWSAEQAERIPILGEPVDEVAVRDAVRTVLGNSNLRPFAIWFSGQQVTDSAGTLASGMTDLRTPKEQIRIFLPAKLNCVFNTSLVHELVHRYDRYVCGRSYSEIMRDPHPLKLFGDDGEGGLTGKMNALLREKYCVSGEGK